MDGQGWTMAAVVDYWDRTASRYVALFKGEFDAKPFDREVISGFGAEVGLGAGNSGAGNPGTQVLDAGCGPCGEVARLLSDQGLEVTGIDISPACVALARAQEPALRFEVMDIGAMAFADCAFDGIVAYYALHYQPRAMLGGMIRELARVLRPGGRLLMVAKDGDDEGWIDDPLEVAGTVYWCAVGAKALQGLLAGNGFRVLRCEVREAMAQEITVRRIYITAERSER